MSTEEDTREVLLDVPLENIMKTVDEICPLPLHTRLTLVNDVDRVLRVEDLMTLIIHNEGNPRKIVSEILEQVWRQFSE